jgi:hypothetical protein
MARGARSGDRAVNQRDLHRHWMHSHEEDTDGEMVFRPASYRFPPARGRTGFDLKEDGSVIEHGIGPTDRTTRTSRRWTLDGHTLKIGDRAMTIVSLDRDRLVLRK